MDKIIEILVKYGAIFYLIFISVLAFVFTVYDKIAAKKLPSHRIPEKTLLIISAFGGSAVMLLTMLLIRHKTLHAKFMVGIPIIIVLQLVIAYAMLYFGIITA